MTRTPPDTGRNRRQLAAGITTYTAAALLLATAVSTIGQGISALVDDRLVVVTPNYVFEFHTRLWGCIHLFVGIAAAAVAVGLFWSTTWARIAAIVIASLSIVSMFFWLSHSPMWSTMTIVFDICIIWAVVTWEGPRTRAKREAKRPQ